MNVKPHPFCFHGPRPGTLYPLGLVIAVLAIAGLSLGCRTATPTSPRASSNVHVEPHPRNPPTENQYLAFKAMAPWLPGYVRVRFPENVNSSLGLHFLDNLEPRQPRVSHVNLPTWTTNPATGEIAYEVSTPEGIDFRGKVRAQGQVIRMAFTIANRTAHPQDVTSQICFDMSPADGLNEKSTLDHTFTWINGQYRSLATTSSMQAAEKFNRLSYNWLLLLYNEQPNDPMRRIEHQCPWWIVDQKPDLPILVRETADRRHLVAISWGQKTVHRLMTNTHIPCLHTDPLEQSALAPGESRTWQGRVFMLENDPQKLLELFLNEGPF
ncbi:MAG: hypothetical protein NTX27_22265 [Verrucomicrobia bacterium]|nr:hypothetical protein [Verrucomicrobiota bacterium]